MLAIRESNGEAEFDPGNAKSADPWDTGAGRRSTGTASNGQSTKTTCQSKGDMFVGHKQKQQYIYIYIYITVAFAATA